MLWAPSACSQTKVVSNFGIVGSTSAGTGVPCNATTLLDGAVTELISAASNTQDSWGIYIGITETGASSTSAQACMDILIGGATDDVLIAALICGDARVEGYGHQYFFPIHIPAGVRIAAQLASVLTTVTAQVSVSLFGGGVPPFRVGRKVTTYGTQVNNARGVSVAMAASGGAASVTEITAATAEDHFAFLPGWQVVDASWNAHGYSSVGIGIGASTEQRIGTWRYVKNNGEAIAGPFPPFPAFCNVPAGTRLTFLGSDSAGAESAYDGLVYAIS